MRLVGLALAVLLFGGGAATTGQQKSISADAAWVKLPAGGDGTAAFVTIDNPTMYDAYLVAASSDVATSVTFRQGAGGGAGKEVGDLMVPAYGTLAMTADGPHLWLSGLKKALVEKDRVTLQLTTDGNVALSVTAEVRSERGSGLFRDFA
jgi:copper(I)-binding protein